jgi:hypothetical protein
MDPRLAALLTQQRQRQFSDFAGAQAVVTLPISDRLLNEAVTEALPPSAPVRDLQLASLAGNRMRVRFKVGSATFLPAINLTLVIERQPELPRSPVLVLRMEMGGLLSLAGPALRFLDALPPGIRVDQDRIFVDLAKLLAERGLSELLDFAEELNVTTANGALVVGIRASVLNPQRQADGQ